MEAFSWQQRVVAGADETAPGGPVMRESAESRDRVVDRLKESNIPLDSMKLVPMSDLVALEGDAQEVFGLNERLAKYVMYVSELERSNKDIKIQLDISKTTVTSLEKEMADSKYQFDEEKRELANEAAAAQMLHNQAQVKVTSLSTQIAELRKALADKDVQLTVSEARADAAAKIASQLEAALQQQGSSEESAAFGLDGAQRGGGAGDAGAASVSVAGALCKAKFIAAVQAIGVEGGTEHAERMLDAMTAQADRERVNKYARALLQKGVAVPVDEKVVENAMMSRCTPEELAKVLADDMQGSLVALAAHGIGPPEEEEKIEVRRAACGVRRAACGVCGVRCAACGVRRVACGMWRVPTAWTLLPPPPTTLAHLVCRQELLVGHLPPDQYEELRAERVERRNSVLTAKGIVLPVDEERLARTLTQTLTQPELKELHTVLLQAQKTGARTALRLERLLDNDVAISDEFLLGTQKGEAWALGELDELIKAELSAPELTIQQVGFPTILPSCHPAILPSGR